MNKQKQTQLLGLSALMLGLIVLIFIMNMDVILKVAGVVAVLLVWWLLARLLMKKPKRIDLATKDYSVLANDLVNALGGSTNIIKVNECQTRVLLDVVDSKSIDVDAIRKLGISGVLRPSNTKVQLIVKELVQPVSSALKKVLNYE